MDTTSNLDDSNGGRLILKRKTPVKTAEHFRRITYRYEGEYHKAFPTLWHSGDTFYAWNGIAYKEVEDNALRHDIYAWLAKQVCKAGSNEDDESYSPFNPKKGDVDLVIDALKAVCYARPERPAWLVKEYSTLDPARLLIATNGVVDLAGNADSIEFPPTPILLTTNAIEYDFVPNAGEPVEWIRFLDQLWPDDRESVALLQEWFGYVLTQETRQQKILMLVGPPRSGKGTIGRVLSAMVGKDNVCSPTLAGLATNFGLASLVGKTLATISDARLSGRTDQAIVTERLLTISGEDAVTIDRKHREAVTCKLPTRIMLCTNELPRMNDASGALASRFLVLQLTRSFLDEEDVGLTDKLLNELPSILKWSIEGWKSLRMRGRFIQSATGQEAIDQLNDLSSPVGAFVRECCVIRGGASISVDGIYEAWAAWCNQQNRDAGNTAMFGRDLRAAVPGLDTTHKRTGDVRKRVYEGIDVSLSGREMASAWRASNAA